MLEASGEIDIERLDHVTREVDVCCLVLAAMAGGVGRQEAREGLAAFLVDGCRIALFDLIGILAPLEAECDVRG